MFCSQCGKNIPDDTKFCPECGANIAADKAPAEGAPAGTTAGAPKKIPAAELQQLEYCFLGAAVAVAVAAVIAIVGRVAVFVVIDGALAAAIYLLAYQKLKDGDYETAKMGSLATGIASGVLGLIGIIAGDLAGIIGIGACAVLVYGFSRLHAHSA